MSIEKNKEVFRRLVEEVWNHGSLEVVDETIAADFVWHNSETRGPEGFKQRVLQSRSAFPDLQITVEDQFAEGDKVAARWTSRGTHRAEAMGIPATGRSFVETGITILRFSGGKAVEVWQNEDLLDVLYQLGCTMMPPKSDTA